ncbi:dihydrofolate reductase [Vibrio owensii]|uniref:dihydrofolate reductase n=1 Tax=Vibrio owensii TaxID=696485 RepID=UPI003CC61B97
MKVSAIACIAANGGLGKNNQLLGHIPEDLAYFKAVTINKAVFMGSNTANSLPKGKPLPSRLNYVLCRESERENFEERGFIPVVAKNVRTAVMRIAELGATELIIIGGAFVYKESLSIVDTLYLNIGTDLPLDADCFFEGVHDRSFLQGLGFSIMQEKELETESNGKLCCYVFQRDSSR